MFINKSEYGNSTTNKQVPIIDLYGGYRSMYTEDRQLKIKGAIGRYGDVEYSNSMKAACGIPVILEEKDLTKDNLINLIDKTLTDKEQYNNIKNNLKDLVSRSSRVGNSWPVLNAGSQLKGTNYYFEVQKGKTENYSGEVVVYSSFITRMR